MVLSGVPECDKGCGTGISLLMMLMNLHSVCVNSARRTWLMGIGRDSNKRSETDYTASGVDYLLGQWTFGHLLGNMVSEEDDPMDFTSILPISGKMNRWLMDGNPITVEELMVPLFPMMDAQANLPFRLLAISKDRFISGEIHGRLDAGEGRFVFTMTNPFILLKMMIWMVHDKTSDFTPLQRLY